MHERRKSDGCVVPAKLASNAAQAVAKSVEEKHPAKENTAGKTRPGHRAGSGASSAQVRVRQVAQGDKQARFTALLHRVSVDRRRAAFCAIRPEAAPGVDGVTRAAYRQDLEDNLHDLHARLHAGRYRVKPSRRVYIPKADGRQRPLGIASLEDKIVQHEAWWRCSMRSMRWTSRAFPMDSGRGAARMMRWTRWRLGRAEESELGARRGYPRLFQPTRT